MINIIALITALVFAIHDYFNCNTSGCVFVDLTIALINLPFAIFWIAMWIA